MHSKRREPRFDHEQEHQGLQGDLGVLQAMTSRRRVIGLLAAAGFVPWLACGNDSEGGNQTSNGDGDQAGDGDSQTTADAGSQGGDGTCEVIPEETEGPFPGDGTNGQNALILSGIVRSDITSSIAGATGVAGGIPLTVTLTLVNANDGCRALPGYAVYLWHCDREGRYSMYNLPAENYLRGVQETDEKGQLTFKTIFPGCYDGRMPHMHFEIYPGLDQAQDARNIVATSQLAFPNEISQTVYATEGYEASVSNFARVSFATDGIFRDGYQLQLSRISGSVTEGFTAELTVAVDA